jgi:predicted tellurium resistance membrane protein TerC
VTEIHAKLESEEHDSSGKPARAASFGMVLIQIAIIDIIFSLDSVITAVGMVEELWVMVVAMVLAMLVMMAFAGTISDFVSKHPTLKILALSFLILIGVMLTAEALGQHMDKGYIYFAMAFAVVVEILNIRLRKKIDPLKLHGAKPQHP